MSCFLLLFNLDYRLCETLSSWECLSLLWTSFSPFPFAPLQKCCAMRDNCLVYSTSLVSNNNLSSNKFLLIITFISLVNVLFPIALQFRLLSVWNIIQLRMSIFTLHVIFSLVPIQKSRALCDNCLVYSTSLVSNYYLSSNKWSVDNYFHFSSECLVSYCSSI